MNPASHLPAGLAPDLWDQMFSAVKVKIVRLLAEAALDHLAQEPAACDPDECGPCWALRQLIEDHQLDALLYHTPEGVEWWDHEHKIVDRNWLALRWSTP